MNKTFSMKYPVLLCLGLALALWASSLALASGQANSKLAGELLKKATQPPVSFCFQGELPNHRLVVVDKSRQRLMVFHYLGEFILEQEYPCATGQNPGMKQKEGDERTPVGIYFTTHRYKDSKVTIFGDRAIHLNYPNPFDKAAGRKGNGIYIHGTNQKLKPRSSNGCITLRNSDLARIFDLIVEQQTPVVVVERLKFATGAQRVQACKQLSKIEKEVLQPLNADQGHAVSVLPELGHKPSVFEQAAPNLAGLGLYRPKGVTLGNKGLMLLGLGDKWVLVANQAIRRKGDKKEIDVTRRFYLAGPELDHARLVQNHWLLKNRASVSRLLAWAPALPARKPTKPAAAVAAASTKADKVDQVKKMLAHWIRDWQSKNIRRYIRHYSPDFHSKDMNRRAWRRHKAYLNKVYKVIRVKADQVNIAVKGNSAKVEFVQHYRSDWHRDVGMKELDLVYRRGRWQIKRESWRKLDTNKRGVAKKDGKKES